jgi:hypothetical protein
LVRVTSPFPRFACAGSATSLPFLGNISETRRSNVSEQPHDQQPDPYQQVMPPDNSLPMQTPAHSSAQPQVPTPAQQVPANPQVIVVQNPKNTPLAVVLGLFFGPLGMLYSTLTGAAVMFCVNFVVALLTFGFGLILTFPFCALWAGIASSNHNSRLAAMGIQHT